MATKYVKLGSKASIFHDPFTRLKIIPGQVVELGNLAKFSKRISNAIKGGHLDSSNKEEYEEYLESVENPEAAVVVEETTDDDSFDSEAFENYTTEGLMALTKDELLILAVYNETELDEKELSKLNKTKLTEEILGLVDEEEDEE